MNKNTSTKLAGLLLSYQLLRSLAGETVNRTTESETNTSKRKKAPKEKKAKRKVKEASQRNNRR